MERGKFYAVGVGPGDPELITLKAAAAMKKCRVIAAAESGGSDNIALKIAEEYTDGKEIIICDMPMIRDEEKLNEFHDASAEKIAGELDCGKDVAFIKRIKERGYETEIVPGITSFSAAAAALKTSLCERSEPLHIIPASYKGEDFDSLKGTKVYMKSGKGLPELRERLKGRGAMMVENATMENERIYESFDDTEVTPGYFSLVIVPAESGGEE